MISASTAFGVLGCGLVGLAVILRVLRVQRFSGIRARSAIAGAAALALLAPFGDFSAAAYLRSLTGDLSVSTLFLAGAACVERLGGRDPIEKRDRRALLWLLCCAAAFLYPAALGLGWLDPYSLGYGSPVFVTVLLLIALAAWRTGLTVVVLVIVVAVLANLGSAYESRNLWDYLLDPLGCGYAVARLAGFAFRRRESSPGTPTS